MTDTTLPLPARPWYSGANRRPPRPPRGVVSTAEVMVAVDIVGRILQRAQLSRWLAAAINGQPVVVVLDGPPGVGKSTLVDWLVAEADDTARPTGSSPCPSRATSPPICSSAHRRHRRTVAPRAPQLVDHRRRALARRSRPAPRRASGVSAGHRGRHRSAGAGLPAARVRATPTPSRPHVSVDRRADHPPTQPLGARRSRSPSSWPARSRRASPIDARIARLAELSGGNPLTLGRARRLDRRR